MFWWWVKTKKKEKNCSQRLGRDAYPSLYLKCRNACLVMYTTRSSYPGWKFSCKDIKSTYGVAVHGTEIHYYQLFYFHQDHCKCLVNLHCILFTFAKTSMRTKQYTNSTANCKSERQHFTIRKWESISLQQCCLTKYLIFGVENTMHLYIYKLTSLLSHKKSLLLQQRDTIM